MLFRVCADIASAEWKDWRHAAGYRYLLEYHPMDTCRQYTLQPSDISPR